MSAAQPKQVKKAPLRHCVVCGQGKEKQELIRVVKNANGEISLDLTLKKAGRGAYICKTDGCVLKAQKKKTLERAFKGPVDAKIYEELCGFEKTNI
jgi:predicted RNA-binding protein YlxR (DUF448 family)